MNLTITVEDDIVKTARMRALAEETSVNAVLREYLVRYAGSDDRRREAADQLVAASLRSEARRGKRQWSREDLHDR